MRWLGKWKVSEQLHSKPQQEIWKIVLSLVEMVKADMDAGVAKDWEMDMTGHAGFMIFEGSETQVYEAILKYSYYVAFELVPIMSLEQAVEVWNRRPSRYEESSQ